MYIYIYVYIYIYMCVCVFMAFMALGLPPIAKGYYLVRRRSRPKPQCPATESLALGGCDLCARWVMDVMGDGRQQNM